MTEQPNDWASTLDAIGRPPGKSSGRNTALGLQEIQEWQDLQRERTGADVAVAVGGVDTGNDFDGWGHVTEWANNVKDGVEGAVSDIGNFVEGVFNALTGQSGATSYVDPVEALTYLADTVTGHTQAIEELKAADSGSENGVSGGDNFDTPYTGSLGPGWALSSTNGITTYVDTSTGKAQWHNSGNANPILTARRVDAADAKTLTEFQRATFTVTSPLGGTNSSVRLYARMSDDGLHYVVAYVSNSTVSIAYTTSGIAGEVVADSGPLPTGMKLSTGAVLQLDAGVAEDRDEYEVRLNGVRAQSWTDTGNLATSSVNYAARGLAEPPKGWGIGWRPGLNLGSWYRPASLAGCTISDNVPTEIKGHGFRVYRESTTATPSLSNGTNIAPYFDEIDYISAGSAWSSAGYTVPKAGHWVFAFGGYRSSAVFTAASFGIYKNGAISSTAATVRDLNVAAGSTVFYCEEGDVVYPALTTSTGSLTLTGDSSGTVTYFSGALMSS